MSADAAVDYSGWIGVKDVAAIVGVSERVVRAAVKRGDLPCHRIGGVVRFILREVEEATAVNLARCAVAGRGKQQRKAE